MVDKINQEEVLKKAKEIIDNFMNEMKSVNVDEDIKIEREWNVRFVDKASEPDNDFKERMLGNAKNIKDECIVAEKKKW